MELPLPVKDFTRNWTRFKLIATAKKWNAERQLNAVPSLLRGKLLGYYVELHDATNYNADLKLLKAALQERAGKKDNPLVASKHFNARRQAIDKRIVDYVSALKNYLKSHIQ